MSNGPETLIRPKDVADFRVAAFSLFCSATQKFSLVRQSIGNQTILVDSSAGKMPNKARYVARLLGGFVTVKVPAEPAKRDLIGVVDGLLQVTIERTLPSNVTLLNAYWVERFIVNANDAFDYEFDITEYTPAGRRIEERLPPGQTLIEHSASERRQLRIAEASNLYPASIASFDLDCASEHFWQTLAALKNRQQLLEVGPDPSSYML